MSQGTDAVVISTIGIDTGKNTLHLEMEKRSRRRIRDLVTQAASLGAFPRMRSDARGYP